MKTQITEKAFDEIYDSVAIHGKHAVVKTIHEDDYSEVIVYINTPERMYVATKITDVKTTYWLENLNVQY